MRQVIYLSQMLLLAACGTQATLAGTVHVVPTPQYLEPLRHSFMANRGSVVTILLGPPQAAASGKMRLAAEFLARQLQQTDPGINTSVKVVGETNADGASIVVWDYAASPNAPIALNLLDRDGLTNAGHRGQGYVIRSPDSRSLWLVGSTGQGALFASMSILQLVRSSPQGVEIPGVYVRDYPDFEFREAAHWLINAEVSRWGLDRGRGLEPFARQCEQKLDQMLRFKINMVLADGFGWGLDELRFEGYAALMRRLNRYARARGIHLLFGGYGAGYGLMYQSLGTGEQERVHKKIHVGRVFFNRESYPDGAIYPCMGFIEGYDTRGVAPDTLGTCRGNDELNRLKAEELRRFVKEVEPGALYIHHEDLANFPLTAKVWPKRCTRCRQRWPNEDMAAADGGAGALAHGYSALVESVNSVRNPESGYDAAHDCQIVLISPVYSADDPWLGGRGLWTEDSPDSEDWARVLELWRNIAVQLPRAANIQLGFREIFPQKRGGKKFTEMLSSLLKQAGVDVGIYVYYASGSDGLFSDYPVSGGPALNAAFKGARTIYNTSGNFYWAPMEIVNAEYGWNVRSTGFYDDPFTSGDGWRAWHRYIHQVNGPEQISGRGGIYARACDLLYGPKAGPIMAQYYMESVWLPDVAVKEPEGWNQYVNRFTYLPETWNRMYAVPMHYAHLMHDSNTWRLESSSPPVVGGVKLDRKELHRRLARRWRLMAGLNAKGADYIRRALAAGPLPDAVDDLRFLETSFRVYQPWIEALADFHSGLDLYLSTPRQPDRAGEQFAAALRKAREAQRLAAQAFPSSVDPAGGGEVGAVRFYIDRLVQAVETAVKLISRG